MSSNNDRRLKRMHRNLLKIVFTVALLLWANGCTPFNAGNEKGSDPGDGDLDLRKNTIAQRGEFAFNVVERWCSTEKNGLTIGIANIRNFAPNDESQVGSATSIEKNKQQILHAVDEFKKYNVNIVVFPEFCLTGYFWNTENNNPVGSKGLSDCWQYMNKGAVNAQMEWLSQLQSRLGDSLEYIIFNNIRRAQPSEPAGPENRFLNSLYVIDRFFDCKNLYSEFNEENRIYDKTFLPGVEKTYEQSGIDDFLVIETEKWGRFGFTICYDLCFSQLYEEYGMWDNVDAIIQTASWRGTGNHNAGKEDYEEMRGYEGKPIINKYGYGYQWNLMAAARAATNQVWFIACNAVGNQEMKLTAPEEVYYEFWGGSGLWAPSGMNLLQASCNNGSLAAVPDELLVIHGIDIKGGVDSAKENYGDYYQDFRYYSDSTEPGTIEIYRPVDDARAFSRMK
jgi:predicted amidohydrolase